MKKFTKLFAGLLVAVFAFVAVTPKADAATVVVRTAPYPYYYRVAVYPPYPVYRAANWLSWHNCNGSVTNSNGTVHAEGTCSPIY